MPRSSGHVVPNPNISLDQTTGIVTFTTAPENGAIITANFKFDVPVRFDTDMMDVTETTQNFGS